MNKLYQLKDLKDIDILEIKQFENRDRDRPDFDNKYLKILFFFAREGVLSTLKKFSAHKRPQVRYLTFLFVQYGQKRYLNVSVQSQKNQLAFVLLNEFYEYTGTEFAYPDRNLESYLDRFNQYCSKADYSEFECDPNSSITYEIVQHTTDEYHDNGLFIYGLGGYVRMYIMQHFRTMKKIACVDYKGDVTEDFKNSYGFDHGFILSDQSFPLLKNVKEPVAIIAAYHSDHATLAEGIFHSNPATHIIIEKPPTVTLEDLGKLIDLYNQGAKLEMGFNRRFIGFSQYVKEVMKGRPAIISCSIKEVNISENHWYLWDNQGTRITGNVVHWFDLANYWLESIPVSINVISHPSDLESSAISVLYKDGSVVNITASDKGNSLRGVQEKIEIRFGNETVFIDDFNSLTHFQSNGMRRKKRTLRRKKGHSAMYRKFKRIVKGTATSDYTVHDLINTSVVTFHASKLLREGKRSLDIEEHIDKFRKRVG